MKTYRYYEYGGVSGDSFFGWKNSNISKTDIVVDLTYTPEKIREVLGFEAFVSNKSTDNWIQIIRSTGEPVGEFRTER